VGSVFFDVLFPLLATGKAMLAAAKELKFKILS
jgi:hypothetical protein